MADITGTSGNNTLNGTSGNDTMSGGDENDTLNGGSGSDILDGGNGNDRLDGGTGDDWIYGDAGDDRLWGGEGNDHLFGGVGIDFIIAGSGDDFVEAGSGSDTVNLDGGTPYKLFGGSGDDVLIAGNNLAGGSYELKGEGGNDIFEIDLAVNHETLHIVDLAAQDFVNFHSVFNGAGTDIQDLNGIISGFSNASGKLQIDFSNQTHLIIDTINYSAGHTSITDFIPASQLQIFH